MLQIAVCDDDILECLNLSGKIKRILKDKKTDCAVKNFQSGKRLTECAEEFDIIFLDIIMAELDGMDTARILRKRAFDKTLIFVSSSKSYVFDAYDVEAFHYLLKPIDDGKLAAVLEKASLKTDAQSGRFIIVNKERQRIKLYLDDIYYFEIWGRKIRASGKNGDIKYYGRMGELEKKLAGGDFFRCHKSYLVNLKYVNSYNAHEAILDNGEIVPVSKRRYDDFCAEYLKAMRKLGGII